MKRSGVAMLLVVLACSSRQPTLVDLQQDGYRELHRGELSIALARADEGTRRSRALGDASWAWRFDVLAAEILVGQRRNAEALARLDDTRLAAVGAREPTDVRALMTRGLARCLVADGDQAFRQAEADLQLARADAQRLSSAELDAEVALRHGTCKVVHGDATGAEAQFRVVLEIARRNGLRMLEAQAAGSLGVVAARAARYSDATDWLERARRLSSGSSADSLVVKNMQNLGWCYFMLGDHERALPILIRAEALAASRGLTGDRQLALINIGRVLYEQRDYAGAHTHYLKALRVAQDLKDQRARAQILGNLAIVALDQRELAEAASYTTEALAIKAQLNDDAGSQYSLLTRGRILAARGDSQEAELLYRDVIASPHTDSEIVWLTHASLAQLLVQAGRRAEAEAEFRLTLAMMERSRSSLRQTEHKIPFFSRLRQFHESYVDFLVDSGREVDALRVADQGRARALQDGLGREDRWLADSADLRRLASDLDAVLLCYWTAPRRSFVWVVSAKGVALHTLPGVEILRQHVEAYQRVVLSSRDPLEEHTPAAGWLYQALIPSALSQLPAAARVIVLPDGPLHQIAFDALVVPGPRPHYWIEDVTFATAPALRLLRTTAARRGRPPSALLAIGAPLSASDEFPVLSHAAEELATIAGLFEDADKLVYSGAAAVPSAYRKGEPARFEYIHFATHASANREIPLDSAVVLSMQDDVYKLYAREIAAIPLNAELVTLSACRSAGSRTFAGEGLVGLAWAFLSAGAENVIGGLWNVEDSSTSELMEEVYRGLKGGLDPPAALRAAKLGLLHSGSAYRKPFYWAPFGVYTRQRAHQQHRAAS